MRKDGVKSRTVMDAVHPEYGYVARTNAEPCTLEVRTTSSCNMHTPVLNHPAPGDSCCHCSHGNTPQVSAFQPYSGIDVQPCC